MNATRILVSQHRAIEALFEELALETGRHARNHAASKLTEELIAHMAAEEGIFYPVARRALAGTGGFRDGGGHRPDEHFMLRVQLRRVLATNIDTPAFAPRVEALRLLFNHHVEAEEQDIFPRVEAVLDASQHQSLGAAVLGARPPVWVVTTEPHAAVASNAERSTPGVRLPSLTEN